MTTDGGGGDPRGQGLEEEELQSPNVTPERLRELAAGFPAKVATHRNAPSDVLELVASSDNEDARYFVARRKNTPAAALSKLARDAAPRVRAAAFANAALPTADRALAFTDSDEDVRAAYAGAASDEDALRRLAKDPAAAVRAAVVDNDACPLELLDALARDEDPQVRYSVVSAQQTPLEVAARLASDAVPEIVEKAAAYELPEDLLERLSKHDDERVRAAVAGNDASSVAVLVAMSKDPSAKVRLATVWRGNTPIEVLDQLALDSDEEVRESVARQCKCGRAALEALVGDASVKVRGHVVMDARLVEADLMRLALDDDDRVRSGARKHPNATAAVKAAVAAEEKRRKKYVEEAPKGPVPVVHLTPSPWVEGSRSTIGGPAWLPAGVPWPLCKKCELPLALFFQITFDDAIPWVKAGSQLAVFACRKHDDIPSFAGVPFGAPLPRDAWDKTEGHVHIRLDPPGAGLTAVAPPSPGLDPMSLTFERTTEEAKEAGPIGARFFVGMQGFKLGGNASWAQDREVFECWCGARMRLVAQLPQNHEFAVDGGARDVPLFLGNELYVLACEKQCDPRAVWPIVQS